jgi:hypothetical protein
MEQPNHTDFAEIALDYAMSCVDYRARPWTCNKTDLENLKDKFRTDFHLQIVDLATYRKWHDGVERLFSHVGVTTAFIAEARRKQVFKPAGQVSYDDMVWACRLVKAAICPTKPNGKSRSKKGRAPFKFLLELCTNTPFFARKDMKEVNRFVEVVLTGRRFKASGGRATRTGVLRPDRGAKLGARGSAR